MVDILCTSVMLVVARYCVSCGSKMCVHLLLTLFDMSYLSVHLAVINVVHLMLHSLLVMLKCLIRDQFQQKLAKIL